MNEGSPTGQAADLVEQILRDELARGDAVIAGAPPVLRYLLSRDGQPMFTEATVARVRGMMLDLAGQLLHVEAEAARVHDRGRYVSQRQEDLAGLLTEDGAFLAHAQALVLEADVTERLQERSGIDTVLPPLVQELAAGGDETTSALSMALLAAQARFMQHCRRMELPLRELPGDLFHSALMVLRARGGEGAEGAEKRLRGGYDESASRLALISRTVMALGDNFRQALSIDRAGPAIFATALAMASRQNRDHAVLSLSEGQFARLLLALRAAGLDQHAVGRQLLFLHPDHRLPDEFEEVDAERAAALLASAGAESAAS